MASIDELLAEGGAPDTSLLEFYKYNLPELNKIHLKDVQFRVLDDIALRLHGTMLRETDWMAFLNELGIRDNRAIIYIKFKSKWREEFPIYVALSGPLLERLTFGDVIKVIMKNERHDALEEIKHHVERLLNNSESHYCVPRKPTAPQVQDCEKASFQGKCESENLRETSIDHNLVLIRTEMITILLLHTDQDVVIARDLRLQLREYGFSVKTLSDFDHLLMTNAFEVMPALLSAVDFVVPIVSESFLRQIRSGGHIPMNASFEELDNEDYFSNNSNNRYIYQLILNEYLQNKCLNFRVRSVMVPDMNRKLLKFDLLLTNSYKLWKEVPDFTEMLRKTKQLYLRISA